jgi:hypothetical protein
MLNPSSSKCKNKFLESKGYRILMIGNKFDLKNEMIQFSLDFKSKAK